MKGLAGQDGFAPHDPRQTLTSLGVVVYDWDLETDAIEWGPNAAEVLGTADLAAWSTGQSFGNAADASGGLCREDAIAGSDAEDAGSGVGYAASYRIRLGNGRVALVDDTGRWTAGRDGRPIRCHGSMRLRRDEGADAPSQDRDRASFLAQVANDLAEAGAAQRPTTMFAIAIANMPELNDALGFEAADEVIRTVLGRLLATVRGRDRFVRYSGNRFALALRGCGPGEAGIAGERLIRLATSEPVGTSFGAVDVRIAIGAASAPEHAVEAGTLLRRAEASLGLAKRRAGSGTVVYDPRVFRSGSRSRREPAFETLNALNGRRIAIALQPVVEATSREPVFSEALLRIEGLDGQVSPAGDIVPALERAGLVHLADIRMLELVTEHLGRDPHACVSLNVSPLTIERSDWLAILSSHLGLRSDYAARVVIEVTETAAIRDPDAMRRALEVVKSLGAQVAIDDFGAGHTSFKALRNFPVDIVKIDGAFVQNLARTPDDRFFVRTLIDLARHLGVASVAEWVEDEDSAALLTDWGVDLLQGDLLGQPELLRRDRAGLPSDDAGLFSAASLQRANSRVA